MAAGKYVRFVVLEIHPYSGQQVGVFHAVRYLRDDGILSPEEHARARELMEWFNDNMELPSRFSRSNKHGAQTKAISWFKPTAGEHISRMWELCQILEGHGRASRPGYVVYEDDVQVTAETFSGSGP